MDADDIVHLINTSNLKAISDRDGVRIVTAFGEAEGCDLSEAFDRLLRNRCIVNLINKPQREYDVVYAPKHGINKATTQWAASEQTIVNEYSLTLGKPKSPAKGIYHYPNGDLLQIKPTVRN